MATRRIKVAPIEQQSFEERLKAATDQVNALKQEAEGAVKELRTEKSALQDQIILLDLKISNIQQQAGLEVDTNDGLGSSVKDAASAAEAISKIVSEIQSLVYEAQSFADEYDLGFRLDVAGYGMGGYYNGDEGEWNASSQSC